MRLRRCISGCIPSHTFAHCDSKAGLYRSDDHPHGRTSIATVAAILFCCMGPLPVAPVPAETGTNEVGWPSSASPIPGSEQAQPRNRATLQQVGTVMALLATFYEAGTLPPEGTTEANQLIKALIQFQSAFMKSAHPEVRQYFSHALERKLHERASKAVAGFQTDGWTSETLEAVVEFGTQRGNWDQREFQNGLREFNLDLRDLDLLIRTFYDTRQALISRGEDLHQIYAAKRRTMPGSRRESD